MMVTLNDLPSGPEMRMTRIELVTEIFSIPKNYLVLSFLFTYKREFFQTLINKMNQFRNTDVSEWTSEQQSKMITLKSVFDQISPLIEEIQAEL
jgi:hypothetical protein